ncbi:hypothetical protein A0H81_03318 [Grifola frondosa]|uniref:DUF6533 domain-containing protein n=1 Tax=Grifola frondosa TaxID=5627 RepID=A0A1C7MI69_GRIFR|nr:hypothetical protein A0H81_03318 [Grifola frondosa]
MSTNLVFLANIRDDGYAGVAALAFMTWDMLINIPEEVECIWRGLNGWTKWMYLFIRYMPILTQASMIPMITSDTSGIHFSSSGCRIWITYEAAVIVAIELAVETMLIMRVYALYNRSKLVLVPVLLCFMMEITAMITVISLASSKTQLTPQCIVSNEPIVMIVWWLGSLAFEFILFTLTLVKFFQAAHQRMGSRSLLNIFVRDGTWAFGLVFVIVLLNTLMYELIHTPLAGMGYSYNRWALSAISFAGSHLILNLRRYCWSNDRSLEISAVTPTSIEGTQAEVETQAVAKQAIDVNLSKLEDFPIISILEF